ncbi:MAG: hypothetical protein AMJ54_06335 [Deltaproteobacteria bacterium SG8_13]|nr:MAG: hypothetical protein AMJ54_06335 [Deltaproteobacteria bacterium SG8_13]
MPAIASSFLLRKSPWLRRQPASNSLVFATTGKVQPSTDVGEQEDQVLPEKSTGAGEGSSSIRQALHFWGADTAKVAQCGRKSQGK